MKGEMLALLNAMPEPRLDLTHHWAGYAALVVFVAAYAVVMAEEKLHLRKSKPVLVAAGLIWMLIAAAYRAAGDLSTVGVALRTYIGEFAELFLFILVAMTFVNTMEERQLFDALRSWLVRKRLSLRGIYWLTGLFAFFASAELDNLTTALVMGSVVIAVGRSHPKFVALGCINVVVAANAGGAFSPFGDITTLMVWQAGRAGFWDFLRLFLPAVVNWLVPAVLISFAVPHAVPAPQLTRVELRRGAWGVVGLFGGTIGLTVLSYNLLGLPPVLGMTTGLGALKLYAYYLQRQRAATPPAPPARTPASGDEFAFLQMPAAELVGSGAPTAGHWQEDTGYAVFGGDDPAWLESMEFEHERDAAELAQHLIEAGGADEMDAPPTSGERDPFDVFEILRRAEWDTLMFFYGIILCVGGIAFAGYLDTISAALYDGAGPTAANVAVGLLSAIVDNIPVMFAVLNMNPAMDLSQWLLVTLTAGVGGSLLAIGSAAGVALLGQARGAYTFGIHLRWSWAIALGYFAAVGVHLLLN